MLFMEAFREELIASELKHLEQVRMRIKSAQAGKHAIMHRMVASPSGVYRECCTPPRGIRPWGDLGATQTGTYFFYKHVRAPETGCGVR